MSVIGNAGLTFKSLMLVIVIGFAMMSLYSSQNCHVTDCQKLSSKPINGQMRTLYTLRYIYNYIQFIHRNTFFRGFQFCGSLI